jgi:hypothetical protein
MDESQRVGRALSSPWSPRAVQARCSLLTSEIRFSMATISGWIRSRGGSLLYFVSSYSMTT